MSTGLLLAHFVSSPWAVLPETFLVMRSVLSRWTGGQLASESVLQKISADKKIMAARNVASIQAGGGNIAVLQLYGILAQRGQIDDVSGPGVTSLQQFTANFRDAANDPSVSAILIDIDSPGGSVFGVQELYEEIMACKKPVTAIANSMAASGAYWIGSAAGEFYCTPGGMVGSIGVVMCHVDQSKALEMDGLDPTFIYSGKFKVEGNSCEPLSEEAQTEMQRMADAYYSKFVSAVSKGRKVPIASVRDGMGQGRTLMAQDAMAEKMVDGVMPFDAVVKKMMTAQKIATPSRLNAAKREIELI
ncbi:MAG: S49 family peptidase [Magnetococcales bacterium]|nr:S49 family peptidase [Magnetococcales bacterium]MBF0438314.1 S49 family peptidase [Magnetococcales bacterium]